MEKRTEEVKKMNRMEKVEFVVSQKARLEEMASALLAERTLILDGREAAAWDEIDYSWEYKLQRIASRLREIEISLLRIENGVYLVCLSCQGEIETEMIRVSPTRKLCWECLKRQK
ncbi:MAG: hypothetical protein ACOX0C_03330 [Patescibacteria group bacterium]|jgi:RNA polymerase-binding transcription factor DksA